MNWLRRNSTFLGLLAILAFLGGLAVVQEKESGSEEGLGLSQPLPPIPTAKLASARLEGTSRDSQSGYVCPHCPLRSKWDWSTDDPQTAELVLDYSTTVYTEEPLRICYLAKVDPDFHMRWETLNGVRDFPRLTPGYAKLLQEEPAVLVVFEGKFNPQTSFGKPWKPDFYRWEKLPGRVGTLQSKLYNAVAWDLP